MDNDDLTHIWVIGIPDTERIVKVFKTIIGKIYLTQNYLAIGDKYYSLDDIAECGRLSITLHSGEKIFAPSFKLRKFLKYYKNDQILFKKKDTVVKSHFDNIVELIEIMMETQDLGDSQINNILENYENLLDNLDDCAEIVDFDIKTKLEKLANYESDLIEISHPTLKGPIDFYSKYFTYKGKQVYYSDVDLIWICFELSKIKIDKLKIRSTKIQGIVNELCLRHRTARVIFEHGAKLFEYRHESLRDKYFNLVVKLNRINQLVDIQSKTINNQLKVIQDINDASRDIIKDTKKIAVLADRKF